MKQVFFAHSFRDAEREIIKGELEALLESHDIKMIVGENLGGNVITQAVKDRILECDGLIALFTRVKKKEPPTKNDWTKDEYRIAIDAKKRTVALFEKGVKVGGIGAIELSNREHIPYDPANRLPALLKLSSGIGEWKRDAGRTIRILLQPDDVAAELRKANGTLSLTCRYILEENGKNRVSTFPCRVHKSEGGSVYMFLPGVMDNCCVELEVSSNGRVWKSPTTSMLTPVILQKD